MRVRGGNLCAWLTLVATIGLVSACGSSSDSDPGPGGDPDASTPAETCEGVDCGEHGECVVDDGQPACECDAGTIPDGLTCVVPSSCEDVDCGDHGECDDTGGEVVCVCDDGYRNEGLACVLDCGVWTSPQELDVPSVHLGGAVTVNGAAPEFSVRLRFEADDGASFIAVNTPSGLWRDRNLSDPAETITVASGAYEVYAEATTGALRYPAANESGSLGRVELFEDTSIDLDIPVVHIDGTLAVNGEPSGSGARLIFVREGGESVSTFIGTDAEFPRDPNRDTLSLHSGTYRIYYDRHLTSDPSNPDNARALIETVELSEDTTLDLDIPAVFVDGSLSIDGDPSGGGPRVQFAGQDGDEFTIGVDADGTFAAPIAPGTYRVSYETGGSSPLTSPRNQRHVLREVEIDSDTTLDLDVPMARLSGSLTIDGEDPPTIVVLRFITEDELDGVGFQVEIDTDGELRASPTGSDVPIVPGRYRVEYQLRSLAEPVPLNRQTPLTTLEISDDKEVTLDVPVVQLTGSLTINGHPASEVHSLRLVRDDGGFLEIDTREDGSISPDRIIPGEYRVYYEGDFTTSAPWSEPPNQERFLGIADLTEEGTVAFDLPVTVPRGEVKSSGEILDEEIGLTFREVGGPDVFRLQQAAGERLEEVLVAPGTYNVRYSRARVADSTPMVINHDLGCFILEDPDCGPDCCVPAPERALALEPLADVVFTADNSASMDDAGGWDTLVAGMTEVLPRFNDSHRMGLWLFPRDDACGVGSFPSRQVVQRQANLLISSLNNASPGGETPLRDAVAAAGDYLSDLQRSDAPRYMVLLAHGIETCEADIEGAIAELEALRAEGIDTFVVGVSGGEAGVIDDLNRLADAGGRPQDGTLRFYPGMIAAQVEQSVDEILSQLTSCRYDLPSRPVLPDELEVWVDGEALPRDAADGWEYRDETRAGIEIRGPACDAILEDELEVSAAVSC